MKFPVVCAFALVLIGASPSPSPSPLPEIAHVFTTDRADETLNNAARTTFIVTHNEIERKGYRTIGEALEHLPAFELAPYGALGASAQYGIRGNNSAQVLVLIDGLPAPGSFSNSVELETLPTTGVDRIELVEGGGSTLYGTGAIGGIVNIITDRTAQYGATVRAGSFGERSLDVRTPHFQFSRIVATNSYSLPDGTTRPNSDYAASWLHADYAARVGTFDGLLRAEIGSDRGGEPGPDEFISPTSRETDLNAGIDLTLTHRGAHSETTMQLGGTNQRITFECDESTDFNCFQPVQSLNTESRLDFGARNLVSTNSGQLLYGIDLSRGSVREDAGGSFSTNALAQTAAYAQQNFATQWGHTYIGVRGERDGALGGELSPSAGFIARLSDAAILRGNIASAFRAPNASELYFPGFGNPALRPERAKVMDLTFTDPKAAGGVSVGWFQNRTSDLIVTELIDPVNFIFAPENVDHALIAGLTLDAHTAPLHGFTAALNVTDLYSAQDLDTQARLPDDPVFVANLSLDYASTGFVSAFGVAVHAAGKRGSIDSTLAQFDQPIAFSRADAYLSLRPAPKLALTLRVYNIGNERYAAVNGFPLPGRSFNLELATH